jgi:hypothetical protein
LPEALKFVNGDMQHRGAKFFQETVSVIIFGGLSKNVPTPGLNNLYEQWMLLYKPS